MRSSFLFYKTFVVVIALNVNWELKSMNIIYRMKSLLGKVQAQAWVYSFVSYHIKSRPEESKVERYPRATTFIISCLTCHVLFDTIRVRKQGA